MNWRTDFEKLNRPVDREFWQRVHRSGKKIVFRLELTVLKFPSLSWKSYLRNEGFPQEDFLTRIIEKPLALQAELVAQELSRRKRTPYQLRRRWLREILYEKISELPFIFWLQKWRFRRKRRKALSLRGLSV